MSDFSKNRVLITQQLNDHIFFMAHSKQVHLDSSNQTSTISGIVYPADDRGLFEEDIN